MNYIVLDTCSILHILRGNDLGKKINEYLETIENPILVISVVTKAELNSIKQNLVGEHPKLKFLMILSTQLLVLT